MEGEAVETVFDPRGRVDAERVELAPRTAALRGLRLGILDNTKWNANRLLRKTAALLEELERTLLDIAHSPSEVSAHQLEDLRKQIEDRGILFKVKVFGSRMEQSAGNTNSL